MGVPTNGWAWRLSFCCVLLAVVATEVKAALPTNCTDVGLCGVDNANCTGPNTQCVCNTGFHLNTNKTSCLAEPGTTCMTAGSDECVANAVCQNVTQEGSAEELQCACAAGFHKQTTTTDAGTVTSCAADVPHDEACSVVDSGEECINDATCKNVTQISPSDNSTQISPSDNSTQISPSDNSTTGVSLCQCNSGFHAKIGDSSVCEQDVPHDGACSVLQSVEECINDATCKNVTQISPSDNSTTGVSLCQCNSGFHAKIGDSSVCEQDIAPGATCMEADSQECVNGAVCTNVTNQADPTVLLECRCMGGYHQSNSSCLPDVAPEHPCTMEDLPNECVDSATCINTQLGSNTTELKCMCDDAFHEAEDDSGRLVCFADTCEDTGEKCMPTSATNTCDEITAYVKCMLEGSCNHEEAPQMTDFLSSMDNATELFGSMDCNYTLADTCPDLITSCLTDYLQTPKNCTTTEGLSTCLEDAADECNSHNAITLAHALATHYAGEFSCECMKAIENCETNPSFQFSQEGANTTQKCTAASELFACAMTTPPACDTEKVPDARELASLWNTALSWSAQNDCKATLTAEAADTCALQLTRCAFIYAGSRGPNKTANCRAAEALGSCVSEETSHCGEADAALKQTFELEYATVSSNCVCINHLDECQKTAMANGAGITCTHVTDFGLCVLGASCRLVDDDNGDLDPFLAAHSWYLQHFDDNNCSMSNDTSCSQDVQVCAHELMNSISEDTPMVGLPALLCSSTKNCLMCVNAANCTSDVPADATLLNTSRDAADARLLSIGCTASCKATMDELLKCKADYDTQYVAAADNNGLKCTAKNAMVTCMRALTCNTYLMPTIEFKYEALKNVVVEGCALKSLQENNSSGVDRTNYNVVITLLLATTAAVFTMIL